MKNKNRLALVVALGTSAVLIPTPVMAATASSSTVTEEGAVAILAEVAPEVFEDLSTDAVGSSSSAAAQVEGVNGESTSIPLDAADGILLGDDVTVGLPEAASAVLTSASDDGVVSFDNGNDSHTVPILKEDGSVQITTVIESEHAPIEYEYALSIPQGATVSLDEAGAVNILDQNGIWLAGAAPAWAVDANGEDVATRYEVRGSTLVQVVEHGSGTAYPVVADPYMGFALISQSWISQVSSTRWVVNVVPTAAGRRYNAPYHLTYHWQELQNRLSTSASRLTPTIREQFYCHVVGNLFEQGTYNMESWYRYMDWGTQLNLTYQCNPGT